GWAWRRASRARARSSTVRASCWRCTFATGARRSSRRSCWRRPDGGAATGAGDVAEQREGAPDLAGWADGDGDQLGRAGAGQPVDRPPDRALGPGDDDVLDAGDALPVEDGPVARQVVGGAEAVGDPGAG